MNSASFWLTGTTGSRAGPMSNPQICKPYFTQAGFPDATSTFPSVWYTGRLSTDPLGVMAQGEASIVNGTGSQTGSGRWGDYTSMNVDPIDDCTFWYVNEYVPTTSSVGWRLRIGAFKFNECGTPDFFLQGDPTAV